MDGPVPAKEPQHTRTWRISLPNVKYEGWVIAFLDSTGCFAALSDWGDVTYRWSPAGLGRDFRSFLLKAGDDYLLNKLSHGRRELNAEATQRALRKEVLRLRRSRRFDKQQAREEWENLSDSDWAYEAWGGTTLVPEFWEHSVQEYPSDVRAFVERAMPRLREALKQSLKEDP